MSLDNENMEFPQPVKIEEEPRETPKIFIDLDKEGPDDICKEWESEIRRKLFNRFIPPIGENQLITVMKEYIVTVTDTAIHFEDIEGLQKLVVNHIEYIYSLYQDSDICFPDSYLDHMEHIMTFFVNLTLRVFLAWKKQRKRVTKQIVEDKAQQVMKRLTFYLLKSEYHIFHVLIRQTTTLLDGMVKDILPVYNSNMCRHMFRYMYMYYLVIKPVKDVSDEAFCRAFILFENWKAFDDYRQNEKIEECFRNVFKRGSECIKNNEFLKKILCPPSSIILEFMKAVGCDESIKKAYFDHIKCKQKNSDESLDDDIGKIAQGYVSSSEIEWDENEVDEEYKELFNKIIENPNKNKISGISNVEVKEEKVLDIVNLAIVDEIEIDSDSDSDSVELVSITTPSQNNFNKLNNHKKKITGNVSSKLSFLDSISIDVNPRKTSRRNNSVEKVSPIQLVIDDDNECVKNVKPKECNNSSHLGESEFNNSVDNPAKVNNSKSIVEAKKTEENIASPMEISEKPYVESSFNRLDSTIQNKENNFNEINAESTETLPKKILNEQHKELITTETKTNNKLSFLSKDLNESSEIAFVSRIKDKVPDTQISIEFQVDENLEIDCVSDKLNLNDIESTPMEIVNVSHVLDNSINQTNITGGNDDVLSVEMNTEELTSKNEPSSKEIINSEKNLDDSERYLVKSLNNVKISNQKNNNEDNTQDINMRDNAHLPNDNSLSKNEDLLDTGQCDSPQSPDTGQEDILNSQSVGEKTESIQELTKVQKILPPSGYLTPSGSDEDIDKNLDELTNPVYSTISSNNENVSCVVQQQSEECGSANFFFNTSDDRRNKRNIKPAKTFEQIVADAVSSQNSTEDEDEYLLNEDKEITKKLPKESTTNSADFIKDMEEFLKEHSSNPLNNDRKEVSKNKENSNKNKVKKKVTIIEEPITIVEPSSPDSNASNPDESSSTTSDSKIKREPRRTLRYSVTQNSKTYGMSKPLPEDIFKQKDMIKKNFTAPYPLQYSLDDEISYINLNQTKIGKSKKVKVFRKSFATYKVLTNDYKLTTGAIVELEKLSQKTMSTWEKITKRCRENAKQEVSFSQSKDKRMIKIVFDKTTKELNENDKKFYCEPSNLDLDITDKGRYCLYKNSPFKNENNKNQEKTVSKRGRKRKVDSVTRNLDSEAKKHQSRKR